MAFALPSGTENLPQMPQALSLVLFQPDIPQNTGAMMRLAACLGVTLEIIEPCGFVLEPRRLRRQALDYIDHLRWRRHASLEAYRAAEPGGRLILASTKGEASCWAFGFSPGDRIMVGRESAGVPEAVAAACDHRLVIPMAPGPRSLNVATAAAVVLGEACRQLTAHGARGDPTTRPTRFEP